jgi:hypothetical protein
MISSTGESEKAADAWQREAFGRSPGLAEFLGQCEAFGTPVGMSSRSSGICEQPVNGLRKRSPGELTRPFRITDEQELIPTDFAAPTIFAEDVSHLPKQLRVVADAG